MPPPRNSPDPCRLRRQVVPQHGQAARNRSAASAALCGKTPDVGSARAFTIVEVMIAVLLMGITFASVAICMQVGQVQYDHARSLNYATEVLQHFAEDTRRLNWTAIEALPDENIMSIPDSFELEQLRTDRFEFTRVVSDVSGMADIKNIDFIATWTGLKGGERSRKLSIRYAENGLYDYYYGVSQ